MKITGDKLGGFVSHHRIGLIKITVAIIIVSLVGYFGVYSLGGHVLEVKKERDAITNPYGGKNDLEEYEKFMVVQVGDGDGSMRCAYPLSVTNDWRSMGCPERFDGEIYTKGGFREAR